MEGFLARAHNPGRLREHFMYMHCNSKIDIIKEGPSPLPRFNNFGMHILEDILERNKHTSRCDRETDTQLWRREVGLDQRSGGVEFILYGRYGYAPV